MPEIVESRENYLEIIHMLHQKGPVRAVDVVEKSGYSKPSVSNAMHSLQEQGYLTIDQSRHIHLTQKGEEIAVAVYKRHKCITNFLLKTLTIDETEAEENACKIEHFITDALYQAMQAYDK